MSTKEIQKGHVLTLTAPTGGVTSGSVYIIGKLVVMALISAAATESFTAAVTGVVSVTKVGSQAWSEGEAVYWDAGNTRATKTAADGLIFLGHAVDAVGNGAGETTGKVRMQQRSITDVGAAVADLAGTLTGTVDGTLADVAAIALSTSDTYTDAAVNTAVNTAVTAVNLQLKELQTKLNAALAVLRTIGAIAP